MLKGLANIGIKSLLIKLAVNSYKSAKDDLDKGEYDPKAYKIRITKTLKKKLG